MLDRRLDRVPTPSERGTCTHVRFASAWARAAAWPIATAWPVVFALWLSVLSSPCAAAPDLDLRDTSRLRIGIGDRLSVERDGQWVPSLHELRRLGLAVDFLQIWLTREWELSWIDRSELAALSEHGITPVVTHYFFADDISKETFESQQAEWYQSLERMADQLRMSSPVLVILEPEFNILPPNGNTAMIHWPGFAKHLRRAIAMIRERAPNVRIGVCVGDFAGTPFLEPVLGRVASELDFIAFQEMRAATDVRSGDAGYLDVGEAAVSLARYLKRAFDRPLLVGYVAVSSHGNWQGRQADALRSIAAHRDELLDAGVFGWVYFQLYDDPRHIGYFGAAERNFGLLDYDGTPKPAFDVFRALAEERLSADR